MTTARELPSQEMLNTLLTYDDAEGLLFWKARDVSSFEDKAHSATHTCNRWNSKFANKQAFTCVGNDGYKKGSLGRQMVRAHRVIWKMLTGEDAVNVDHIDGDRLNNRKGNLRAVDATGNRRNAARHRDSKAPFQGVRKTTNGLWQAYITVNYKWTNLGCYETIPEAIAARKAAEVMFDFHHNHGRIASD